MILVYLGDETRSFRKGTTFGAIRAALGLGPADPILPCLQGEWYVDTRFRSDDADVCPCSVYRAYQKPKGPRSILRFMVSINKTYTYIVLFRRRTHVRFPTRIYGFARDVKIDGVILHLYLVLYPYGSESLV